MTQRKFESEFKKVLKEYGINVYREYDRLHAKPMTNLGELFISCNDGWISMRFAPENFSVSKFFAKFSEDEPINVYSYKWNIHFSVKEVCILELDRRLNALMR